jgi:hypothetical protein
MSNQVTNVHDAFFKQALSDTKLADTFLREHLPADVVDLLGPEPPEPVRGSFRTGVFSTPWDAFADTDLEAVATKWLVKSDAADVPERIWWKFRKWIDESPVARAIATAPPELRSSDMNDQSLQMPSGWIGGLTRPLAGESAPRETSLQLPQAQVAWPDGG